MQKWIPAEWQAQSKDEVPTGTFCSKEEVPPGTFHGGEKVPTGTFHGVSVSPCSLPGSKEEVPPGTFHSTIYYRTKDGRSDYGFSIERQPDGSYRPYITSQPSYQGRDTGGHPTHRLNDGGRPYVCWTRQLWSDQEARQVAALWADATQEYIRGGRRF